MFAVFYFLISLTGLVLASYTDLKERIVSNKITYPMIVLGLVLHLEESFFSADYWIIVNAVAVTVVVFFASYLLWKAGVWAGGDVKIMTGLAALNPVNYAVIGGFLGINSGVFGSIGLPVFPLTLFVFSVFAMFPYGVMITIFGMVKNREVGRELWGEIKKMVPRLLVLSAVVVGAVEVLLFFGFERVYAILVLIPLYVLPSKIRLFAGVILFLIGIWLVGVFAFYQFVGIFAPLFLLYLVIKLYLVSKDKVLKTVVKISELKEGMISSETIVEEEHTQEFYRKEPLGIGKVINYLRNNKINEILREFRPKGRLVVNSRSAAGVTLEQMDELKTAVRERKLEDRIKIKLSAPFIPAMLIAYVILQVVGDVLWIVLY